MKKEDEIPIGTRVRLSKEGLLEYKHQSKGGEGIISTVRKNIPYKDDDAFRYSIRWDNGNSNDYKHKQVEIVQLIMWQIF